MYDIIIIGGGPSGLTAALYALRANKKTLVLEANMLGGQIVNASIIENYPALPNISGFDFTMNLQNQVLSLNGEIKYERVLEVTNTKDVITPNNKYQAKNIIIATGLNHRKLNLENEDKFIGKGISYCATCDGNFYKNKTVAVIGGGNTAIYDAIYLSKIASIVYLVNRSTNYRAESSSLTTLRNIPNIEILENSTISKIKGTNKLESIIINEDKEIFIDGLFIAIGEIPNNKIFSNVVDLNDQGYIITNDEVKTKTKGIYAIGDTRVKDLRQLVTATSDGALAIFYITKDE